MAQRKRQEHKTSVLPVGPEHNGRRIQGLWLQLLRENGGEGRRVDTHPVPKGTVCCASWSQGLVPCVGDGDQSSTLMMTGVKVEEGLGEGWWGGRAGDGGEDIVLEAWMEPG